MPLRILKKIGAAMKSRSEASQNDVHDGQAKPSHNSNSNRSVKSRSKSRPSGDGGKSRPSRRADASGQGGRSPSGDGGKSRSSRRADASGQGGRPPGKRRSGADPLKETRSVSRRQDVNDLPKTPAPPAEKRSWSLDDFVVEPKEGAKRFHDFDLPDEIMHAVADLGFKYCTPIQAASLEHALAGANVAGRAQTGTGKTAAFLIAILTRFLRDPEGRAAKPGVPRALVIAPTRELCVQICQDAQLLGAHCGLRTLAVFGGMDYSRQQRQLADGPVDLLVATPGRLLDFQRQHILDLGHVDTLVIDEADRMLDMGFIPDVRRIIRCLPDRDKRKTMLYSATLSQEVMRLASQWMPNPVVVEIEPDHVAGADIQQRVLIVTAAEKFTVLCNLLRRHDGQRVLIFGNRRMSTDRLAMRLQRHGFECELLSGDVQQTRRMRVVENFRADKVRIVVATDVAGRGLHIADIGLVVNYELPYEAEDYVHRIGRTGRAGKVGTAVSFACEDESFVIPEIEKYLGDSLKCELPEDDLLQSVSSRRKSDGKEDSGKSSANPSSDVRGRQDSSRQGRGRRRGRTPAHPERRQETAAASDERRADRDGRRQGSPVPNKSSSQPTDTDRKSSQVEKQAPPAPDPVPASAKKTAAPPAGNAAVSPAARQMPPSPEKSAAATPRQTPPRTSSSPRNKPSDSSGKSRDPASASSSTKPSRDPPAKRPPTAPPRPPMPIKPVIGRPVSEVWVPGQHK